MPFRGRYSDEEIQEQIRARQFDLIVYGRVGPNMGCDPLPFVDLVRAHYRPREARPRAARFARPSNQVESTQLGKDRGSWKPLNNVLSWLLSAFWRIMSIMT